MDRRKFLGGIAVSIVMAGNARASALPSMPLWFKRSGTLFPPDTSNETDIIPFNGRLIAATFNRPPLTQEVIFRDISDPTNPILISRQPCPFAMGGILVDPATNILHMYGSNPPARNSAPYNSLLHVAVNADWTLGAPNTILGPSGMGFNNIGVSILSGGGFAMAIGQAYGDGPNAGLLAQSFITSSVVDFSSFAVKSAFFNSTTDFIGARSIRPGSDGWVYVTSDSLRGFTNIARTRDFVTFKFCTNQNYAFLGPDSGDAFSGTVTPSGPVFYDGNVSWCEWIDKYGNQECYAIYFEGNESTTASVKDAHYQGNMASLISQFAFQT